MQHVTLRELFPTVEIDDISVFTPLSRGAASLTCDEIVYLSCLVKIMAPRAIFEIGTFRGYTIRALARHAPRGCEVYTLDLPPEELGKSTLRQHSADLGNVLLNPNRKPAIGDIYLSDPMASQRITQFLGSSDTFDFSPLQGKVDIFFIDGAHSYDFVVNDTAQARKCLSARGVIVWHDLTGGWRGLVRFFKEFGRDHLLYHLKGTSLVTYWPNGIPDVE
ncbi:MAG: class I SAM-dependent methyltransferase [Desulfobaccales bacterium]